MAFDWIDQYARLKKVHERFPYVPESFDERGEYVEIAKTDIKGRQIGEKYQRQLEHLFEKGQYERDLRKLEGLKAKVDSIYRQFSWGGKSKSTYDILEAQALAVATESPSLLCAADKALEERLKKLPVQQREAIMNSCPESFYPTKDKQTNVPF